ncbi:MAG: radical SAM protein [Kiritimatiellae bacterium]|jgi:wyosine [tRNA(Phe)-imidazoG37] synthetase (radical SAM superfamily)|nr:radical SAM protein [Kiritimatiellia bacterium]NLD90479.1 radical SAM protein [Lentisphaerota bacterium]HPC20525.1 radical SAM protein [Kiritimatiellia bacterium]HQN80606.1 radical SAM protein [Kiritimatiellia bacterium]HQQ61481.1 radical SAM protein [Kiritimatiellia bacterium]
MEDKFKYLFGPVPSRRLGRSLGVDLNPVKVCTENCVFCQIGRTTELTLERREWVPTADVLAEFDRWVAAGGQADHVTLSGSGEPTMHVGFGAVLRHVKQAGPFRTALLSNGSLMWQPEVRRDAAAADVIKVTLSAWDEDSFQRIHRPAPGLSFARLLEGEQALRREFAGRLWVEVMLLPGYNDEPQQVQAIADLVKTLAADAVHLNTTSRPAMAGVRLPPVPEAWLRTVAAAFSPVAEVPAFLERMKSPAEMSDESLFNLLARHPIALTALAASAGMEVVALEQRLAPLVAAGRLVVEDHHGVRMLRARSA